VSNEGSSEGSGEPVPKEWCVVNPARVVSRPAFVLGLAGGAFFLIGGAAAAVVAILLAAIPGLIGAILLSPGRDAGDPGSMRAVSWRTRTMPTPLARR
jgi:hypothetical protein